MYLFKLGFSFSSDMYSGVDFVGSYGSSDFNFFRNLHMVFPEWLHQFTVPPIGFPFLDILANTCYCHIYIYLFGCIRY